MSDSGPPRPKRRWLMGCGAAAAAGIIALGVFGGYLYWRWQAPPQGWVHADAALALTPAARQRDLASAVEKRVLAELSDGGRIASSQARGTTTLTLTNLEINAWLAHRLPMWAANRGVRLPGEVGSIRYWAEDGRPVIAAQVTLEGMTQVISATLDITIHKDGSARLALNNIRGGQLALPHDRFMDRTVKQLGGQESDVTADLARFLAGEAFEPIIPLDGHRQARLIGVEAGPDALTLTLRPEPAPRR